MQRLPRDLVNWSVTTTVVCLFLAVDFFVPCLFHLVQVEWLALVGLGMCIGQINLAATWSALAPGNVAVRVPWSLLITVLMWYSLVLGNRVWDYPFEFQGAIVLGLVLISGLVVAQIPLWIAAKGFRWKLVSWRDTTTGTTVAGTLQFQLKHLLLGMSFLSIALAPARVVLPQGNLADLRMDDEFWLILPVVAVSNLLITVPCIWGAFARRRWLAPLAIGWAVYCGGITALEFGVLAGFLGSPNDDSALVLMYLLNLSQAITVFGVLVVFRAIGFRLLQATRGGPPRVPLTSEGGIDNRGLRSGQADGTPADSSVTSSSRTTEQGA